MKLSGVILVLVLACASASAGDTTADPPESIESMLGSFVEDFRSDPAASFAVTFGVHVEGEGDWHVVVKPASEKTGTAEVRLLSGLSPQPTVVFKTDRETLSRIHRGQLAALTAMGKAKSSDLAPLDIDAMEGFQLEPDFIGRFVPLIFHFWTRGLPEIIQFGEKSQTRVLHGGNAVLFYYQPGFRSGWFQIEKGQHVNAHPEEQTNPFPSMFAVTAGQLESRIGGKPVTLHKGETVFIPPGVSHEFWNDLDLPAEGILMMFGEGA